MTTGVSFLLTSYNKAAFLPSVLTSVEREYQQLGGQIIIIDDGSSDGSGQICADFSHGKPHVTYIASENTGVFAALRRILPMAKYDFARPVDSDDPLLPGSTQGLIDIAHKYQAGLVFGRSISYGPNAKTDAEIAATSFQPAQDDIVPDGLAYLVLGMNFTSTCALYTREALQAAAALPQGFISCQDFAMAIRGAKVSAMAATKAPVCFYLRGVANQFIASEALTQHQTAALIRDFWPELPPDLQRKAAVKLAMRARRWRRHAHKTSGLDLVNVGLLIQGQLAKYGIGVDQAHIAKIEALYEPELSDVLKRRKIAY